MEALSKPPTFTVPPMKRQRGLPSESLPLGRLAWIVAFPLASGRTALFVQAVVPQTPSDAKHGPGRVPAAVHCLVRLRLHVLVAVLSRYGEVPQVCTLV